METTMDLEGYTVLPTDSIETAMRKIQANHHRAVVVVDEERTVLGMVSDGDIRRSFLRGVMQMAPVQKIMNPSPITTRDRDPASHRELMRARKITLLPVVDERNRIQSVALSFEPHDG